MREWGPLLHVERKPGVTFTHIHDFLSRVLIGLDMAALAGTAANKTNFLCEEGKVGVLDTQGRTGIP